ncbi:hypothetical protein [Arthrobacter sp. OV608]|uniref:hypothetical protein n=1 Tax=Arthrobacter sp. OV608 TaxID=1882768 RepID=UPI001113D620|nr:hypothetical protein [Arthrobacter sp. OV608]
MDPVTLIVAALAAGAARSAEGVAEQSLKDAYAGLKGLVKRFFRDRPAADMVLEEHATDSATYQVPLEKHVRESGAAQDAQVLEAAKKLLALADPEGARRGEYIVGTIKADRGGVAVAHLQGDVHAGYNPDVENKPDPS